MPNISKVTLPSGSTYDIISKSTRGLTRATLDVSSTGSAFVATTDTGITALYDGLSVVIKNTSGSDSGASATLNVNNLGAKAIVSSITGSAIEAGDWASGAEFIFVYDSGNTRWVMQGGSNIGTITDVQVNGTSVVTDGVANVTEVPASILTGAIPSSVTATTQTAGDSSTKIATTAYVDNAVSALPEPMVFKGSVGTGGTITDLPVDGSAEIGWTYKVITDGTYAGQAAEVGDTFICDSKSSNANTWVLIPSGDEPGGTVTSVSAGVGLTTASGSDITTSGEVKAKLKSETALTETAAAATTTAGRVYPVAVDTAGDLAVNVPWVDTNTEYTANTTTVDVVASSSSVTVPVVDSNTEVSIPNVTSVGAAPTLGTAFTVPNVTSAGAAPTLGTAFTVPNVTSVGAAPTLGTDIDADDITAWTTNVPTSFSVSDEELTITAGTAASLSYTAKTIPNVTSVGSAPTLGEAFSIPNVTDVGSAATLGTAFTIPNVTDVGSAPTLGTAITATNTVFGSNTSATAITTDSVEVVTSISEQ